MGRQRQTTLSAAALLSAVAATTLAAGSAAAAGSPQGVWLNDTGRGAIEIKTCGSGLCGHVVWVKAGSDAYGCGKQIIGEVKSGGDGTWGDGWIYSPERKKRYDVELEPQSNGTLRVTGFAGVRFLSKTMIWKPAPANLQRCDQQTAAVAPEAKPAAEPAPAPKAPAQAAAVPAPKAAAPAEDSEMQVSASEDEASAPAEEETSGEKRFNFDDGITVGDVFSMKKSGEGKCRIKTPWTDITVDCDRNR